MDTILRGIAESNHTMAMKMQLICKIADAGTQPHQPAVVRSILELSTSWVLDGDTEFIVGAGYKVYQAWIHSNPATLETFFSQQHLMFLLESKYRNQANGPNLIRISLQLFRPGNTLDKLVKSLRKKAVCYIRTHQDINCLRNFSILLQQFMDWEAKSHFKRKLCSQLIETISQLPPPPSGQSSAADSYIQDIEHLARFLNALWIQSDISVLSDSLHVIFESLSKEYESSSICLGALVPYIPTDIVESSAPVVTDDPQVTSAQIVQALNRMLDWLAWPKATNVDQWIIAFFNHLAAAKNFSIIITVTLNSAVKVFMKLLMEPVQDVSFSILSHMLLGYQHSPEPFHQVLKQVPAVWTQLEEKWGCGSPICTRLAELLHTLMYIHVGFPEFYQPILNFIKKYPKPSIEEMKSIQNRSRWNLSSADNSAATYYTNPDVDSAGRVGLFNRGTTCYVNTVLQALFMNDRFRQAYLTKECLTGKVTKLFQDVLAKLSFSQRPCFLPTEFLEAVVDPQFAAFEEHDCTEFLKHLFDQLEEEQKKMTKKFAGEHNQSGTGAEEGRPPTTGTIVEETFSGRISRTTECLKCKKKSVITEEFKDLVLPLSKDRNSTLKPLPGGSESTKIVPREVETISEESKKPLASDNFPLPLEKLIQDALKPEEMSGENQYHCEVCHLQNAVRTSNIVQPPNTLILTLNRFAYDPVSHKESKILTPVNFPRVLLLPVQGGPPKTDHSDCNRSILEQLRCGDSVGPCQEVYGLTGIMVHGGDNSNTGHYFAICRHAVRQKSTHCSKQDVDFFEDTWFRLNDRSVYMTTFDKIQTHLRSFANETPYVLLYQKIGTEVVKDCDMSLVTRVSSVDPPMRTELRNAVTQDNTKYLEEVERSAKQKSKSKALIRNANSFNWKDSDFDKGSPGNCGGGGGLGDLDTSGARFVF